nr:AAA family ATPase [uncultured Janthinobacterium sp.]
MTNYIDKTTLTQALRQLQGTAGTLFRIWLTLKHMGLAPGNEVSVTTTNCSEDLKRLFSCGHPDGKLFTPFVSIPSDKFMAADAGRSIIQTTIRQWVDGSGVYLPTDFLDARDGVPEGSKKPVVVSTKRVYPEGLGLGKEGFAHKAGDRVSIPSLALAVWYGRQVPIPDGDDPDKFLMSVMRLALHLSPAEEGCVFVAKDLNITLAAQPLTDEEIFDVVNKLDSAGYLSVQIQESKELHIKRIRSMQTVSLQPAWLTSSPEDTLEKLIDSGAKAILLYGPPRTGKTRIIDQRWARNDPLRKTIQIHDGWGYEELIQGYRPQIDQTFKYEMGVLTRSLIEGKKLIVLEEINRTQISQALGEVFSLIEEGYRGEANKISLRDDSDFFIPEDVVFFMTMNTIDKSTEEVDDALLGRFYCVEFPPRVEDLAEMLRDKGIEEAEKQKLCSLFGQIQDAYPLGHGYFAQYTNHTDPILFYKTKIRPVLLNHLQHHKPQDLSNIDNLVDELFSGKVAE